MSDAELDRQWLTLYDTDRLFRYSEGNPGEGGMSVGQERFHRDSSPRRLLRAATQIGKTRAGAAEAWWVMLDRHPYRPAYGRPTSGWIVIPDLNDWPKLCKKLREIEPPNALDSGCHYDTAKGYTYRGARGLMTQNGSFALPKSGTQQQTALAGDTLDWLWFDEPPRESHWGEALSRLAVTGGSAWLTFTPIGKPLAWLKTYLHGNAETNEPGHPEWSETLITLTQANVPHRTAENIATQIAEYSPWEYAQRVEGAWSGVTADRWFSGFSEGCIVESAPGQVDRIGLGADYGEGAGRTYVVLVAMANGRLYAIDEYSAPANSTPAMDAKAVLDMLARNGLGAHHVSAYRGDVNSGGKLGLGLSINEMMSREFARLTKSARCPFDVSPAAKGKGSVESGRRLLNNAFISGNALLTADVPKLAHSCRHWRGGADEKDACDGFRYIATEFLDATPRGGGKLVMV